MIQLDRGATQQTRMSDSDIVTFHFATILEEKQKKKTLIVSQKREG